MTEQYAQAPVISAERLQELQSNPYDFTPSPDVPTEFEAALAIPEWRISHLYKIMVKSGEVTRVAGEDADPGGESVMVMTFKPNKQQRRFLKRLWYRNLVLKARQLGYTTLICILYLDYTLFGPGNTRAGIIAHTEPDAQTIFRDKVKFAYDHLPDYLRAKFPLDRDSARELLFKHNNSSIRVGTSMRSGTIHYLHISEYGKLWARMPARGQEVQTGSLPAVPDDGIVCIESTAEGDDGDFYKKAKTAEKNHLARKRLTREEYRFHFEPWWREETYRMDPEGVEITEEDHQMLDETEMQVWEEMRIKVKLDVEQRAWYISVRNNRFGGDSAMMWQEMPSTPKQAFDKPIGGAYLVEQLTRAKREKRIVPLLPHAEGIPCWTFWDIGNGDGTAIWVIQQVGAEFRCIDYYEAIGKPYSHFTKWLQDQPYTYDAHYLPHDATHERQGETINESPLEMLQRLLPNHTWEYVERVNDITHGIQQLRNVFSMLRFDETKCADGLRHLRLYRKKWIDNQARWDEKPDKTGGHSEAADSLRQFAQAYHAGQLNIRYTGEAKKSSRKKGSWKTA